MGKCSFPRERDLSYAIKMSKNMEINLISCTCISLLKGWHAIMTVKFMQKIGIINKERF